MQENSISPIKSPVTSLSKQFAVPFTNALNEDEEHGVLFKQLIHGLRIHSPDGSSDKLEKTVLLKLRQCSIFTGGNISKVVFSDFCLCAVSNANSK